MKNRILQAIYFLRNQAALTLNLKQRSASSDERERDKKYSAAGKSL